MHSRLFTVAPRASHIQLVAAFVLLSPAVISASWRVSQFELSSQGTDLQRSIDQMLLLADKGTSAFQQTALSQTIVRSDNDTSALGQIASTQLDSWHNVSQFAELAGSSVAFCARLQQSWDSQKIPFGCRHGSRAGCCSVILVVVLSSACCRSRQTTI